MSREMKDANVCLECIVAMRMALGITRAVLRFSMAMISWKFSVSYVRTNDQHIEDAQMCDKQLTVVTHPNRFA